MSAGSPEKRQPDRVGRHSVLFRVSPSLAVHRRIGHVNARELSSTVTTSGSGES
jgi:hypothetical protein